MNRLDSAELNTSVRMNRSSFLLISSLMLLGPLLLLSAVQASADPYYNSSESGCDGSDHNVLFCEDFETPGGAGGRWYGEDCDTANAKGGIGARTKGWCGTIFQTITPAGAAVCGAGVTPFGNCAGYGGNFSLDHAGGMMALRHLKTTAGFGASATCGTDGSQLCNVDEIYVRYYWKVDSGYLFGNEKSINITTGDADIAFADITFECGAGNSAPSRKPQIAVNYGSSNLTSVCSDANINPITMTSGRWYFIELNVRVGSNARIRLWVNDCGTSGTSCGATPILRTSLTGSLPGNNNGSQIQTVWLERWSGFPSIGSGPYWDQVKASTVGPIGFAGSSPPAPTNLRVQ